MNSSIFEKPEFACLSKERIEVLKDLAQKSEGKSSMEMIKILTEYSGKFSKGNPLSDVEKQALIALLRENMDVSERKRLDQMMGLMKMMGK